jgi:hypothetical protein
MGRIGWLDRNQCECVDNKGWIRDLFLAPRFLSGGFAFLPTKKIVWDDLVRTERMDGRKCGCGWFGLVWLDGCGDVMFVAEVVPT